MSFNFYIYRMARVSLFRQAYSISVLDYFALIMCDQRKRHKAETKKGWRHWITVNLVKFSYGFVLGFKNIFRYERAYIPVLGRN